MELSWLKGTMCSFHTSQAKQLGNSLLLLLSEMKKKNNDMFFIQQRLWYSHLLIVDCKGNRSGRWGSLTLIWEEPLKVELLSILDHHMNTILIDYGDNKR